MFDALSSTESPDGVQYPPPASYEHAVSFCLTPYDTGLGCEGEEVKPPPRWGSQICIEVPRHQQCVYS